MNILETNKDVNFFVLVPEVSKLRKHPTTENKCRFIFWAFLFLGSTRGSAIFFDRFTWNRMSVFFQILHALTPLNQKDGGTGGSENFQYSYVIIDRNG